MAVFGIDTSQNANDPLRVTAAERLIGPPRFWGRYFNGTTDSNNYQYKASESAFLRGLGIPVLCFARQMWAVSEVANAEAHAKKNMDGLIAAFGAQYLHDNNIVPRLYLDLEPEHRGPQYVMAQAYYEKWSAALLAGRPAGAHTIKFRPAVYLNLGQNRQSFLNLHAACHGGSICDGVWPAKYVREGGSSDETVPPPMSDQMVWSDTPPSLPDPIPPGAPMAHIPKIGWQYYGDYPKATDGSSHDGDVDFDMVNPAHESLVLSGCVLPPP